MTVGLLSFAATIAALSQRSVLNIGFSSDGNEYRFINHFQIAEQFGFSGGWNSGATWMQSIGSNGWPNSSIQTSAGKAWGGGVSIPASWQYGDVGSGHYYVFKFSGNGEFKFSENVGSWTLQAGMSTNVTVVSSDRWKTTSGTVNTYMVFNYTGPAQLFPILFFSNDADGVGATGNVSNVQFYRLDDETDLLAGKIFRAPYKANIVSYCPSAIRFMDWIGGNNSAPTRFDTTRTLPGYGAWGGDGGGGLSNWVASPAYGETTGTNQYSLAAATGTTGNPQTTPISMTHGELVTCRIGAGMVRGGSVSVSAITNANPGKVTATAHGFSTGDVISHQLVSGVMAKLNLLPCTITVVDANSYTVGVDTTTFGSFSGSASANQFITLNVGARGAFPVVFPSAATYASNFGNAYIATHDYKTFIFDKTVSMQTDGAGNYIYGAWLFNDTGANNGHNGGVPLEICTALVNEVNAMGPAHPIGMWMNIPHKATSSMDPDYTTGANWGIQAVNVVLNGANGFAGLTAAAKLFVEYSNETWNTGGGNAVSQTFYLAYRGSLRWPASGTADYASMHALRSTVAMNDIAGSSYYNSSRVKFIMSGQGTLGLSGSMNQFRIDGTTYFLNDAANPFGPTVAPMVHHDDFSFAGYFDPNNGTSYDSANLAGFVSSWVSHIGNAVAQEADCASYVTAVVNTSLGVSGAGNETIWRYGNVLLPAYASYLKTTYSKSAIMYEGGWDHDVEPISYHIFNGFGSGALDGTTAVITGVSSSLTSALSAGMFVYGYGIPDNTTVVSTTSTTITLSNNTTVALTWGQFMAYTPTNAYLRACKRSQAWASAMLTYFGYFNQANAGMPSDYVEVSSRWGHTYPSAYGFKNTEWGDLDLVWQQEGTRNQGLT